MTNEELAQQVNDLLRVGRLEESCDLIDGELEARNPVAETVAMLGIVDAFHKILPTLPHVRDLTEPRKRALRARMKERHRNPGFWAIYFSRVARSDFLTGRAQASWRASFDWLLKPINMTKVLEGNYDPPRTSGLSASDEAAFALSGPA